MKKLIAAAIAAVSLSAFAAWERIGALQVADVTVQGAAIAKIGIFMGNPLAAAGMAAMVADTPTLKFFGPVRDKTPMAYVVFLDGEAFAKSSGDALDTLEFAVLYPISVSKEEFLKRHKGSSETNGVIVVKGNMFVEADSDETTYVVFSEDGKWVVDEKAFKAIQAAAKADKDADPDLVETLGYSKALSIGIKVSDLGIDIRGTMQFDKDSEGDKCGLKPLGQSPFASAGKDAIYADVQAEDAGSSGQLSEAKWAELIVLLKKHGLDIVKFVTLTRSEKGDLKMVLDAKAICKAAGDKGAFEKFDMEKFLEDAKGLKAKNRFSAKSPAYALSMSIKDFTPQWPIAERFAATLPEAASKKPYAVAFFSLSSTLKAVAGESFAAMPEEQRAMMKPVLDQLATETKGGCASMLWRQDDIHRMFFRISADECKCLGGIAMSAMMFGMEGDSCDDEDDDEEDDN